MLAAEEAPDGFSARHDARSRTYLYRVLARRAPSPFERGRALWWPHRVDVEALAGVRRGARRHARLHRLHADRDLPPALRARRPAAPSWRRDGDVLEFWIEADAFMRNMNRVLVGTMLEVAGGRRTVETSRACWTAGRAREAGATAPPHGLYLASVRY